MFKNQENESQNKQVETIIGKSVVVKGNFHGDGNIVIEGEVEGSVKTKNNLKVGPNAKISANISAKNAEIAGRVNGNISVSGLLELAAEAVINGDVSVKELSVARGAKINGHCRMGEARESSEKSQ